MITDANVLVALDFMMILAAICPIFLGIIEIVERVMKWVSKRR